MTPAPTDREPRTFWLYEGNLDFDLEWKKILAAEFPSHVSKTECIKVAEVIPGHIPPEVRQAHEAAKELRIYCVGCQGSDASTMNMIHRFDDAMIALESAYPNLKQKEFP
jgi:hypothetical protein